MKGKGVKGTGVKGTTGFQEIFQNGLCVLFTSETPVWSNGRNVDW